MKQKISILTLLCIACANGTISSNFAHRFLSHFGKIGLIKPKFFANNFSRPCTYLKNDAPNNSPKIQRLAQSVYIGAASLGSFYYLNSYLKRSQTFPYYEINLEQHVPEVSSPIETTDTFITNETPVKSKKTFEEDDARASTVLAHFINEKIQMFLIRNFEKPCFLAKKLCRKTEKPKNL